MLSNSKYTDQFFIRGRHYGYDIYYLSKYYFDLPKRTIRKNSEKTFLFTQTIKDIENIYRAVGGYDMRYDKLNQIGKKYWEEEYHYLCFDRSEKIDQGRYCFCRESKNNVFWKQRLFD